MSKESSSTRALTLGAILTAIVIVLQLVSTIKFGPFSLLLVLIPVVIGATTCGKYVGAWLGFVSAVIILIDGEAALFYGINIPATIITVLLKGTLSGFAAGLIYELISKKSVTWGVICSAITAPIVNTGIFILGCYTLFGNSLIGLAGQFGFGKNITALIFIGFIGINFFIELGTNLILIPVTTRIVRLMQK